MKKIAYILSLWALAAFGAHAQPLNRSTPESTLKSAREAEETNNPYFAREKYQELYDDSKDREWQVKIALLDYELRDYDRAEKALAKIVTRDRKGQYNELKYFYAMCLKHNGKYAEAAEYFNQYLNDVPDTPLKAKIKNEIAGCEMARKAKANENLKIANIGKKANSPQTEASPSFNNGKLYFTSLQAKEVIVPDKKDEDWHSKVYFTTPAGEAFGAPTALGEGINREGWHQGNVSVTPDGSTMYFTRVELQNNAVKSSKIYYALNRDGEWGAGNEVGGVNGDYIAKHPCEGELFGERVLFFVADMPGGKGGFDIYYAPKKSDGLFGQPVNLGEVINTAGDEASPFYIDGRLYFSSNGLPTFGGLDVFESQWNGAVWSAPKNLGLGINTSLDDLYYSRSADGFTGFLVSNRPGINNLKSKTCCDDIYAWEIERVKVDLMARTFRLKRKNEKENQPLAGCTVEVYEKTDGPMPKKIEGQTNPSSNEFNFTLEPDKAYLVIASRDEYRGDTISFNTAGVKKSTKVEKKLTLRTAKVEPDSIVVTTNEPIRLNNIYYDFNDDKILPDAEKDLQFLVDLMNRYKDMVIELSSHTDSRGSDDYNERLSQRRAESARRWMIERGISAERIVAKGYGEKQILNGCTNGVTCSDDEHRFNRRTEFKILSGPTSITIERKEKRPVGQNPGGKQSLKPLFFSIER